MPLTVWLCAAIAFWLGGAGAALAAAVVVPALGFLALSWRERWARVREDALLFARVLRHPRGRDPLTRHRARLVREFDEVLRAMDAAA